MQAFLFPGQGSQHVGMAADLFKSDPEFRDLVKFASDQAGEDLERLCLHGPDKRLRFTPLLQPLLVAISLGYLRRLLANGVRPDITMGHSMGEITALAASGVISFEEAITIAAKRGALMEESANKVQGGMLAVTTNHREQVLELLSDHPSLGLANDNAPTQIVVSGELDALAHFADQIKQKHLGRCQTLPVSGPWHSSWITLARDEFRIWSESLTFRSPQTLLILNSTGEPENDSERIKHYMTETLVTPVRWRECMNSLAALNPKRICEVGPGRVLTGLARANGINGGTETVCVNNLRGVELATHHADGGEK